MKLRVDVVVSARGYSKKDQKLDLEVSVGEVRRLLSERLKRLKDVSESMRIILSGKVLEEDDETLILEDEQILRVVFVERRNRAHVDSLTPFLGLTTGGAQVTITGENFMRTVTMARFGMIEVPVKRYSATVLTCISPPHEAGIVSVEVETAGEGFTSDGQTFTYVNTLAEGATIALRVCDDSNALAPVSLETSKTVNPFIHKK